MLLALAPVLLIFLCSPVTAENKPFATRIVGGQVAKPNAHPYQLAFEIMGEVDCGASIVNANWAISAAHCTKGHINVEYMKLIAGEHDITKKEGTEQERMIAKIVYHPKYKGYEDYFRHDIALIKVKTPFKFNKYVQAIPLAAPNFIPKAKTNAIVTGWGVTDYQESTSDVLRKVTVPIVAQNDCAKALKPIPITTSVICAGYLGQGGKDACQGDSGGPLVEFARGNYTLIGIVSSGTKCATKDFPGLYTNVGMYRSWIDSIVKEK